MSLKIDLLLLLATQTLAAQPKAHFHHLHLNTTNPEAAAAFYTTKFEAEKRPFDGAPAVRANSAWLLFNRVAKPPASEVTSAIWHMGWGGGDMRETYPKQLASGTAFRTPLTDLSDQCDGRGGNGRFLFAYVDGPDHALIELNTTAPGDRRFGHLHLLSADPIAAGEWYMRHFGLTPKSATPPSREKRFRCGRQTGPAVSLMLDAVNVIIYPVENAQAAFPDVWKNRKDLESSKGHAIDHVAFAVEDLTSTLKRMRASGIRVMGDAFIEGPDHILIELVEQRR